MKRTLVASALVMAFGLSGMAWANGSGGYGSGGDETTTTNTTTNTTVDVDVDLTKNTSINKSDSSTNKNSGDNRANGARSVALNNGSAATFSNAFNVTTAVASSVLKGSVSHNAIQNIGNWAQNNGSAAGARGGSGGAGGSGGSGGSAGGGADDGGYNHKGGSGSGGSSGTGGDGGNGGNAAAGGSGGNGGLNTVSAGTFNMSNTMSGVGQSAAGILVANQNSGLSSMVQQSVNVQANLAVH